MVKRREGSGAPPGPFCTHRLLIVGRCSIVPDRATGKENIMVRLFLALAALFLVGIAAAPATAQRYHDRGGWDYRDDRYRNHGDFRPHRRRSPDWYGCYDRRGACDTRRYHGSRYGHREGGYRARGGREHFRCRGPRWYCEQALRYERSRRRW
jgi:hypothetical protein